MTFVLKKTIDTWIPDVKYEEKPVTLSESDGI